MTFLPCLIFINCTWLETVSILTVNSLISALIMKSLSVQVTFYSLAKAQSSSDSSNPFYHLVKSHFQTALILISFQVIDTFFVFNHACL